MRSYVIEALKILFGFLVVLVVIGVLRVYFHPEIEEWSVRRLEEKINRVHGTNSIKIVDYYYSPSIWSVPYVEWQDGTWLGLFENWRRLPWNPYPQIDSAKFRGEELSDLSSLKPLPLRELDVSGTGVDDLEPIKSMSLLILRIQGTPAARKSLPEWLTDSIIYVQIEPDD